MPNSKCRSCGLVNMASDTICRRCQADIVIKPKRSDNRGPRASAGRSTQRLWSLLALVITGAVAWYLYKGVERSYEQVQANEAVRTSAQANQGPAPLGRTQYDQQRAGQYGNAVQSSQGLNSSRQHTDEINKLMGKGPANK
jgi:hypothetical protein